MYDKTKATQLLDTGFIVSADEVRVALGNPSEATFDRFICDYSFHVGDTSPVDGFATLRIRRETPDGRRYNEIAYQRIIKRGV